MDGVARLWTREGLLKHSLAGHSESIFSLRFDARGQRLLTGPHTNDASQHAASFLFSIIVSCMLWHARVV